MLFPVFFIVGNAPPHGTYFFLLILPVEQYQEEFHQNMIALFQHAVFLRIIVGHIQPVSGDIILSECRVIMENMLPYQSYIPAMADFMDHSHEINSVYLEALRPEPGTVFKIHPVNEHPLVKRPHSLICLYRAE